MFPAAAAAPFGWLFAEGYHAPAMMALARRQAWTIKPPVLHRD
jgi:hypothetical protein